ncbi:MAG TPA: ATP-binding cassette domain-containing protein [Tenericutes bacterium]|nr:ATP-binding cassette domain-containing protein [Mycoplasmatota bacterium]
MLSVSNMSLKFKTRTLFDNVNLKFENGNCYGLIGANGAGKSTFLKILTGEIEPTTGTISIGKDERISFLKQDHYAYNEFTVLETVIMGNSKLYSIIKEKEELYSKSDFTEKDGIRAGDLEAEFEELNGWQAESDAAILLSGIGIDNSLHYKLMSELTGPEKVKVLLAQALFGEPNILLLDEPTNDLDIDAKMWLEEFLINFPNTVIVVSHDRHFLNKVCTHIVDIDYEKITQFVGNYDFWYESSQLMLKQVKDSNKKKEDKIKELQDFIRRFSANASKSRQATSRKKILDKIVLEELKPSTRKYPFINFKINRPTGNSILEIEKLNYLDETGNNLLKNFNLTVFQDDKIAFIGNELAITALFEILNDRKDLTSGTIKWGQTIEKEYFPKNNEEYFVEDVNLIEWLRNYSNDKTESFIRGFLGRMLFSGDEVLKSVKVLSGGEKARCIFSKMMINGCNFITLDDPTNHLDIETITSLNNEMTSFKGNILFSSHDHELLNTVANRIIEIHEDGTYTDKMCNYDEYISIKNQ